MGKLIGPHCSGLLLFQTLLDDNSHSNDCKNNSRAFVYDALFVLNENLR